MTYFQLFLSDKESDSGSAYGQLADDLILSAGGVTEKPQAPSKLQQALNMPQSHEQTIPREQNPFLSQSSAHAEVQALTESLQRHAGRDASQDESSHVQRSEHQSSEHQSWEHQSSEYQSSEYQSSEHQSSKHQSSEHQRSRDQSSQAETTHESLVQPTTQSAPVSIKYGPYEIRPALNQEVPIGRAHQSVPIESISRLQAFIGRDIYSLYIREVPDDPIAGLRPSRNGVWVKAAGETEFRRLQPGEAARIYIDSDVRVGGNGVTGVSGYPITVC